MPQPTQKVSNLQTFLSRQTTILRSFNCSKFVPLSLDRGILHYRPAKQWRLRQDYLSHFSLFRSNQRNRSLSYEDCHQTQSNGSQDEDSLEVILFLISFVRLQFPVSEKFTRPFVLTSDPDPKWERFPFLIPQWDGDLTGNSRFLLIV